MRRVALVALAVLALVPSLLPLAGAANDCTPGNCVQLEGRPGPTPAVPGTPTFYVYYHAATCAPNFSAECTGAPESPVGFVGLVYEETNGSSGLQRFSFQSGSHTVPADQAVLL